MRHRGNVNMAQKHNEYNISVEETQIIKLVKLISAVLVVFIHAMPDILVEAVPQVVRFSWTQQFVF